MHADRIQRLAADERRARSVGFGWGFAEGLVFFIVPDVYISFATLFSLRAGAVAWAASIAGSAAAIPVIYVLSVALGLDYVMFLESIPGISPRLIERVAGRLAADGLPYTPLLVLGGIPLKVYAGIAFSLGMPLATVVLWTVFARIVRIAPTYALVAAVQLACRRRILSHPTAWCVLHAGCWVAFYVFYFVQMSHA